MTTFILKLQANPFNINMIQVYAPTLDYKDAEVELLYQDMQNGVKQTISDEVLYVVGDLSATAGKDTYQKIAAHIQ